MRCHPGAPRLGHVEISTEHLATLEGWTLADNRIAKTFSFANYYETMAFVNATAWSRTARTTIRISRSATTAAASDDTHAVGGVTENDSSARPSVEAAAT